MYLNWALGLRELGCDVIWLEQADASSAGELGRQFELLRRELAPYGLSDRIALHGSEGQLPDGALPVEALEQAELLVNMAYEEPGSLPIHFRRSVLIDIDPGMTQLWGSTGSSRWVRTTRTSRSGRGSRTAAPVWTGSASNGSTRPLA